jgi:hypothetical protein
MSPLRVKIPPRNWKSFQEFENSLYEAMAHEEEENSLKREKFPQELVKSLQERCPSRSCPYL